MRKSLPLSISSLEEIIENNYIYVDKTEFAYNLFKKSAYKYVFLSRPRRFGKSLFLDTLKQIFLGKKHLFEGLWIYSSDYDWKEYPIIHIDFSEFKKTDMHSLEVNLIEIIDLFATKYNIENVSLVTGLNMKFAQLIKGLKKVVILIDEYDKPILDNIADVKKAEQIRDLLKSFYEVIKANDYHIRALFMTGVAKFSQVSIFSGLNNLIDISLDDRYADILGYTQEELGNNFGAYIEEAAQNSNSVKYDLLEKIRYWYNGYRFTERELTVYNPYSVMNFFDNNKFKNYWFATGTPTFLIKLIKNDYPELEEAIKYTYTYDIFNGFELSRLAIVTILYQTGYLTIEAYYPETQEYKLGYPNFEVQESFNKVIVEALADASAPSIASMSLKIYKALLDGDLEEFKNLVQTFISKIPSELLIDKEIYYNTIFHCILSLVSNMVTSQISHFKRRPDTIVTIGDNTYIFELKLNKTANDALKQILDKKYYEPYIYDSKNICLVGVNFNTGKTFSIDYEFNYLKDL